MNKMSIKSNDNGRAFEFICLNTLHEKILSHRPVIVEQNSSFYAAKRAWENIDEKTKEALTASASAAVDSILDLEPLILEDGNDTLNLRIQMDEEGEKGDVRDILIIRRNIHWEIGLSLKHNHFAVKHSRLAKSLDFGNRWFKIPCSDEYWDEIRPIFDMLEVEKNSGKKWSELTDKENDVYIPLLNAFITEIKRSNEKYDNIPRKMVEYLLGEFDFYKVISVDRQKLAQIQAFNLRGTLNKNSCDKTPEIIVPISSLPSRIVSLDFKPNSTNTVELYMDAGWQFSFRIHNASTRVETSLKFDVQIIGMPATIITINCSWR